MPFNIAQIPQKIKNEPFCCNFMSACNFVKTRKANKNGQTIGFIYFICVFMYSQRQLVFIKQK